MPLSIGSPGRHPAPGTKAIWAPRPAGGRPLQGTAPRHPTTLSAVRAPLGISLAAAGAVLLWLGLRASESFASGVTRLFSGSPTKESVLLLAAGAALAGAGVWVLLTAISARARPGPRVRPRRARRRSR